VCSKNDPAIAMAAFSHPHLQLRPEDFAIIECSWEDKIHGLTQVSRKLNLGTDALVFADDNPVECALVRQQLPSVAVVELGSDPGSFVAKLEAEHWFDLPAYTPEDLARAQSYTVRRQVEEARAQTVDMPSFLRSLEMRGRLYEATGSDLPRIAQLEQKTNQFNLTTRRYSASAIDEYAERPDVVMLAFGLRDKFGNHGLVSSLIGLLEGSSLRIDSWLMSCRVFSRTVEAFIMQRLIDLARQRGAQRIVGEYLPTERNRVVADLYQRLGFECGDAERRIWVLDLRGADRLGWESYITEDGGRQASVAAG
jgi:FkbH-like protein